MLSMRTAVPDFFIFFLVFLAVSIRKRVADTGAPPRSLAADDQR